MAGAVPLERILLVERSDGRHVARHLRMRRCWDLPVFEVRKLEGFPMPQDTISAGPDSCSAEAPQRASSAIRPPVWNG